jgi:hypothetical protein
MMFAVFFVQYYTGRLIPNAWPSAAMLKQSAFVKAAVGKPLSTYFTTLLTLSPVHMCGLLVALMLAVVLLPSFTLVFLGLMRTGVWKPSFPSPPKQLGNNDNGNDTLHILPLLPLLVLALWPVAFLAGLTVLGNAGSGFQSRFLLPLLPGTMLLASIGVQIVEQYASCLRFSVHYYVMQLAAKAQNGGTDVEGNQALDRMLCKASRSRILATVCNSVVSLCCMYSLLHTLYYGVLFAPLFAELDVNLFDILKHMLLHPYKPPPNRESFVQTLTYMAHFGLIREAR